MKTERKTERALRRCLGASALVAAFGVVAAEPACTKDVDLTRLEGTWVETDSKRHITLKADGEGFGPFGALGAGCDPSNKCIADNGTCMQFRLREDTGKTVGLCAIPCSPGASDSCPGDTACHATTPAAACLPDIATPTFKLLVKGNAFDEYMIEYGDDAFENVGVIPCGPCKLSDDNNHLTCQKGAPGAGFGSCNFDRDGIDTGTGVADSGAPPAESGTPVDSGCSNCSGRCVDTQNDRTNCGGCGIVCDSGACNAGRCTTGPTPAIQTLATASGPVAIAVDTSRVYWADQGDGKVTATSLFGGAQQVLFSGAGASSSIAVDLSGNVYWTNGSSVWRGTSGGGATPFASGSSPVAVAVDPSGVYWLDSSGVMKTTLFGSPVGQLAPAFSPHAIAVDGANVYWTDQGTQSVKKVSNGGGMQSTLAGTLNQPFAIAVFGGNVYWTTTGDGTLWKLPTSGGPSPQSLAKGLGQAGGLAVDGTNVYWTSVTSGTVNKVGINGGATTELASKQPTPAGIAVDGTSVYWANIGDGRVQKLSPK